MKLQSVLKLGHFAVAFALPALVTLGAQSQAQVMQSKLVPADGDPGDRFGQRVALIPGWAFAASPQDDDVQGQSGAVYVHELQGNQWAFAQKLKASDPSFGGIMGSALAASGEWMVATTPHDDPQQGFTAAGSAHVFRLQNGIWAHHQKVLASDFNSGSAEYFGTSAAIDGSVMVIGEQYDDYKAANSGSAYVFELQGSTWVETAKLSELDWEVNGWFGSSAAVDGNTLVVGAYPHNNGIPNSLRGAAYVFEKIGGTWTQTQKLLPNDPAFQDAFGVSVAISGDTILVGSLFHQHTPPPNISGAAYVFTNLGGTWVQTQELAPTDPWIPLYFGSELAIEGDIAILGAKGDADQASGTGSAYAFRRVGSTWEQFGKMLAPDAKEGEILAYGVAMAGTKALLGAYGDDDACGDLWSCDSGSAYVFDLAPDAVQYCHCTQLGPCGNHDDFGGCATSSGQGAVLSAAGSSSVAADALVLETRWLPPNIPGILFMGGASNGTPFGDGRLCLSSGGVGVFRLLPAKSSGAGGAMTWNSGLVAMTQSNPPAGQIAPGQTWYLQAWFRDPTGPCGSSFNLSNGLRVVFTP